VHLVSCPYFTTNMLDYTESVNKNYSALDSFVIHVCLEGSYELKYNGESYPVKMGECLLVPNSVNEVELSTTTGFKILESYIA
jgi:mannose-6-phosphate isomerase